MRRREENPEGKVRHSPTDFCSFCFKNKSFVGYLPHMRIFLLRLVAVILWRNPYSTVKKLASPSFFRARFKRQRRNKSRGIFYYYPGNKATLLCKKKRIVAAERLSLKALEVRFFCKKQQNICMYTCIPE